eukprot:2774842-Pyramimonas_sp.AAC.1
MPLPRLPVSFEEPGKPCEFASLRFSQLINGRSSVEFQRNAGSKNAVYNRGIPAKAANFNPIGPLLLKCKHLSALRKRYPNKASRGEVGLSTPPNA